MPGDQLGYIDTVFDVGGYLYKVYAVTGPGSEFLVGACKAVVTCFGLETDVSGLDVSLSWEHVPLPLIPLPSIFVVSRDGVEIARTESPSYKDTVPAPGRYLYGVDLVYPDTRPPSLVIGRCIVGVPGPLPPPRDLRCAVLSVDPGPIPFPLDPRDPAAANAVASDPIRPGWRRGGRRPLPRRRGGALVGQPGSLRQDRDLEERSHCGDDPRR